MRMLTCEECRKRYDFDKDDFCPRCGAFNQPEKKWGIDAKGNVIRVDGVNEQNHSDSFVHREVHREKDVRRAKGLDWKSGKSGCRQNAGAARSKAGAGESIGGAAKRYEAKKKGSGAWLGAILMILFLLLKLLFNVIH